MKRKNLKNNKIHTFFLQKVEFLKTPTKQNSIFTFKGRKKSAFQNLSKINKYLFKYKIMHALSGRPNLLKKIDIKVTQNNIFGTILDLKAKKIVYSLSTGKVGVETSYKKMNESSKIFLNKFLLTAHLFCFDFNDTLFNISAPLKLRKTIYTLIKKTIKKKRSTNNILENLIINFNPKKCFNGCRLKKKSKLYRFKRIKKIVKKGNF